MSAAEKNRAAAWEERRRKRDPKGTGASIRCSRETKGGKAGERKKAAYRREEKAREKKKPHGFENGGEILAVRRPGSYFARTVGQWGGDPELVSLSLGRKKGPGGALLSGRRGGGGENYQVTLRTREAEEKGLPRGLQPRKRGKSRQQVPALGPRAAETKKGKLGL